MKSGLQRRYVLATFGLLVAMILVITAVLFAAAHEQQSHMKSSIREEVTQNLEQGLQQRADSISSYLSEALFDSLYYYNPEEAYHIIKAVLSIQEVAGIYVVDTSGNIFHDGTHTLVDFGRRYHDETALQQVLKQGKAYSKVDNGRLILGKPIRAGNELIGALFTEFWKTEIQETIQQTTGLVDDIHERSHGKLILSVSITAAILIALGILSAIWIARSMTRPLRELIDYTERLGKGDFSQIDCIDRQDEIGELAHSFNRMGEKLEQRTEEISHQAYHDALTGLPNRARFIQYLDSLIACQSGNSFAVLFIDLDEFKSVNDHYGHKAGDVLLRDLAERMKDKLRVGDLVMPLANGTYKKEVVARIGGDEFLICLPNISQPDDVVRVVDRLFEAIRSPVMIGHDKVVIGGSIGVACYPHSGESADELIKNADIAMYQAKASGKNTYSLFTPQMVEQVEKRGDIERELRKALESPAQFELWYQPQVELDSQQLVGAEALVRWRHPQRGLIPPGDFIPVAEDTGLITPLGEALFEQLCQQLDQWREKLLPGFHVSLNLSARQVCGQGLADIFADYLKRYDVPANYVHAEITESSLMRDEYAARQTLNHLRELGIEVWLDDFGTGFSSLSYLRRFPVDGLKIDRSFIADIEDDPQDRALSEAIISMAGSLELGVVAEGIEKAKQVELLQQQGCRLGQGYYFSAPLPAEDFESSYLKPVPARKAKLS